jgi:hypothetical protein
LSCKLICLQLQRSKSDEGREKNNPQGEAHPGLLLHRRDRSRKSQGCLAGAVKQVQRAGNWKNGSPTPSKGGEKPYLPSREGRTGPFFKPRPASIQWVLGSPNTFSLLPTPRAEELPPNPDH